MYVGRVKVDKDKFDALLGKLMQAPPQEGKTIKGQQVPPAPCSLGTGETAEINWQKQAHGLAASVPKNALADTNHPPNPHSK